MHIGPVYIIAGEDAKRLIAEALAPHFSDLARRIDSLKKGQEILMTGAEHLAASIGKLTTDTSAALGSIKTEIEGLKAQIAGGSPVTDAQLEALATQVDTADAALVQAKADADAAIGSGGGGTP